MVWFGQILLYLSFTILYIWSLLQPCLSVTNLHSCFLDTEVKMWHSAVKTSPEQHLWGTQFLTLHCWQWHRDKDFWLGLDMWLDDEEQTGWWKGQGERPQLWECLEAAWEHPELSSDYSPLETVMSDHCMSWCRDHCYQSTQSQAEWGIKNENKILHWISVLPSKMYSCLFSYPLPSISPTF